MNQAVSQDQMTNPAVSQDQVTSQEETHRRPAQGGCLPQARQGCLPQACHRKSQAHHRREKVQQG